MIPDCVRQTVGRSDGRTESIIAKTALCIARAVKNEGIASVKLQIRRFQPPHFGLTIVLREMPNNLYSQKLESLAYISVADCMGLCYFSRKVNHNEIQLSEYKLQGAGTKAEFDIK